MNAPELTTPPPPATAVATLPGTGSRAATVFLDTTGGRG